MGDKKLLDEFYNQLKAGYHFQLGQNPFDSSDTCIRVSRTGTSEAELYMGNKSLREALHKALKGPQ